MKHYNTSIAIQVLPKVDNNEQLIEVVDKVIELIKSRHQQVVVGPFETVVEGDYEQCMETIRLCNLVTIQSGAPSVMSYVKISYHSALDGLTIDEKIKKHQ